MKSTPKLKEFFEIILSEVNSNPNLEKKITDFFNNVNEKRSKRNKRKAAVLDPIKHLQEGRDKLFNLLTELDIEQLKDIIAEYGMDQAKLVMKWKNKEKIIEHIIQLSEARLNKGKFFKKTIMKYDKTKIIDHALFIKHKSEIDKTGIESFINGNGISIIIVPFYKHPNAGGQLIGFHFRINYTLNNENREYNSNETYETPEDATTYAILKSFDIILKRI